MATRIVIACVHDRTEPHPLPDATPAYSLGSAGMAFNKADMCQGGRVLTEGEFALLEPPEEPGKDWRVHDPAGLLDAYEMGGRA